jgi:hypothetical protein
MVSTVTAQKERPMPTPHLDPRSSSDGAQPAAEETVQTGLAASSSPSSPAASSPSARAVYSRTGFTFPQP